MKNDSTVSRTPVAGLPKQKTFNIDYYSEQEGRSFTGLFVVRRPNILDQARIEAEKSKILGGRYYDPDNPGVGVPEYANNIAEAVAFLRVVIEDSPEWWENGEVADADLLFKVYSEAEDMDPFRRIEGKKAERKNEHVGGDSDTQHIDARPDDMLAGLVDEEIPLPTNQR